MSAQKLLHLPTPAEAEQAKVSSRTLSKYADVDRVKLQLRGSNGESDDLILPGHVLQILLDVLSEMSKGNAISLIPIHREISTQEAAHLLNVSRPFLVGLLEKREIPFRKVGAHRRVLLADVLAYKEKTDKLRTQALDELAALSQEDGAATAFVTPALIPETTLQRYLSGMAALNLPSEKGTGDWHLIETFLKPKRKRSRLFIAGVGCEGDTTPLLGDRGIFECSSLLDRLKIPHPPGPAYAADHARAIADLVLVAILEGGSPDFVRLDDWMPGDDDKQTVFDLLNHAIPQLTIDRQEKISTWMKKNSY
jgi:excisionase family DNA binding protein